jgi:hypothetical protein
MAAGLIGPTTKTTTTTTVDYQILWKYQNTLCQTSRSLFVEVNLTSPQKFEYDMLDARRHYSRASKTDNVRMT